MRLPHKTLGVVTWYTHMLPKILGLKRCSSGAKVGFGASGNAKSCRLLIVWTEVGAVAVENTKTQTLNPDSRKPH